MQIDPSILAQVNEWLTPTFDNETHEKIKELISSSPNELKESFYKNLEFGTGGMRGIMGVGTNRINKYTLGKNTQGLADYMHAVFVNEPLKVAIAYDCRHNSDTLAKVVADVFSANGIHVYLFSELRPTPELSFAVRYLNCQCGIVLTASHNPPEYNGYKVYWKDGGQIVPPQDHAIVTRIEQLKYEQIKFEANPALIEYIDTEIDNAFIDSTIQNASCNTTQAAKDNFSVVYTPLHGTSIVSIPPTLAKAGYKNVFIVKEQEKPDGNFPTVKSPNPEEPEALALALKLADEKKADMVVGTDPDCDRLGIAVRNNEGKLTLLNGNQVMVLMCDFLLTKWKNDGKLNGNQFIGSTIVSTPMVNEIAAAYQVECKVGLTGFKWIAKMIVDFPELQFVAGGEESFGFMVGDSVRDKDAVAATLLACEIAAHAKSIGSSLYQELEKLYVKHGFYKEKLISLTKKGIAGAEEIKQMMVDWRENPLKEIAGEQVVMVEDYLNSTAKNQLTDTIENIDMPKADVLIYYTENGTKIAARPSGTEPKIKFYISVNQDVEHLNELQKTENQLDQKIEAIINQLQIN